MDQIGGDNDPRLIVELVRERRIAESRINESARRVLRPMFQLGLFEDPYVDPAAAQATVGKGEFARAGATAQRRSIVLLKNARSLLPLPEAPRLYVENVDKEVARRYGEVVENPADAQVAIVKVDAPCALHPGGGSFFRGSHEGTLAYEGAENAGELASDQEDRGGGAAHDRVPLHGASGGAFGVHRRRGRGRRALQLGRQRALRRAVRPPPASSASCPSTCRAIWLPS